ncbi:MAG: hypothetical protein SFW07_06965 [Gammaproteobacteria bacterium]|nr:hypothetical protein [Gammaproteobacteria bacterium]
MANKYSGGISWSLTAQDIIELLKDPNSVIYKALQGFLIAINDVAQAAALIVIQNTAREWNAFNTSRGVSVDVDREVFSPNKLPPDLVSSAIALPEKENMIGHKIEALTKELAACKDKLIESKETQLKQFNESMGSKYPLTETEQELLSKSYETVVAETEKAVPAELTGKPREKLVQNRSAVGMEMNLMMMLLKENFKPSEVKEIVKLYKEAVGQYLAAERENFVMTLDIKRIEIDIMTLKMTRGFVQGCAAAQNNLENEESSMLSRAKNPFQMKPVPPVK